MLSGVPAVLALATDVTKSVASAKAAGYSIGKLFTALPTAHPSPLSLKIQMTFVTNGMFARPNFQGEGELSFSF